MKESKLGRNLPYILLAVIFLVVIFNYLRNVHDDNLLENSHEIKAILIKIKKGSAVRSTPTGTYKYVVDGNRYEYEENRNFNDLKIGDTILIEYAKEDPSVARVVDKYYMKKYRHLKK